VASEEHQGFRELGRIGSMVLALGQFVPQNYIHSLIAPTLKDYLAKLNLELTKALHKPTDSLLEAYLLAQDVRADITSLYSILFKQDGQLRPGPEIEEHLENSCTSADVRKVELKLCVGMVERTADFLAAAFLKLSPSCQQLPPSLALMDRALIARLQQLVSIL
jgi:hypothetical protein